MTPAEMFILIVVGLVVSAMGIRAYNTYRNVQAQVRIISPARSRQQDKDLEAQKKVINDWSKDKGPWY